MSLRDHLTDAAIASAGNKTMYAGASTTIAGWLTVNNVVAVLGLLIAMAGFLTNYYYRRRDHKITTRLALEEADRRAERHRLQMEVLRNTGRPASIGEDDS
jgi:beta-lactamase regulating signal transducer with metallopeptidase domain